MQNHRRMYFGNKTSLFRKLYYLGHRRQSFILSDILDSHDITIAYRFAMAQSHKMRFSAGYRPQHFQRRSMFYAPYYTILIAPCSQIMRNGQSARSTLRKTLQCSCLKTLQKVCRLTEKPKWLSYFLWNLEQQSELYNNANCFCIRQYQLSRNVGKNKLTKQPSPRLVCYRKRYISMEEIIKANTFQIHQYSSYWCNGSWHRPNILCFHRNQ